ncbi:hypothetical protein PHJA_002536500 [Phtheirospermum japonicum]|uniref:Uncharacterized protein n=1 Tax=Phtheirospermum japonicum TaxID=374723 RepID=A0A830CXH1_9LAMI|nr:hypothetical protein PHJA_002536500 [Phtheirospermum japonicum]
MFAGADRQRQPVWIWSSVSLCSRSAGGPSLSGLISASLHIPTIATIMLLMMIPIWIPKIAAAAAELVALRLPLPVPAGTSTIITATWTAVITIISPTLIRSYTYEL